MYINFNFKTQKINNSKNVNTLYYKYIIFKKFYNNFDYSMQHMGKHTNYKYNNDKYLSKKIKKIKKKKNQPQQYKPIKVSLSSFNIYYILILINLNHNLKFKTNIQNG